MIVTRTVPELLNFTRLLLEEAGKVERSRHRSVPLSLDAALVYTAVLVWPRPTEKRILCHLLSGSCQLGHAIAPVGELKSPRARGLGLGPGEGERASPW